MANVTLISGQAVDDYSEEWRHECEARSILSIPTLSGRRAQLARIDRHRGIGERERLQRTMAALFERARAVEAAE